MQLAFPYDQHVPPERLQRAGRAAITRNISDKLLRPKPSPALRSVSEGTSAVTVPKAAVDENHRPVLGQYDVWPAWK